MENKEKWKQLKISDLKKIKKSKFSKDDSFVEKNIQKYVVKNGNLTYYLTVENENTFIRCFCDYKEITFDEFLTEQERERPVSTVDIICEE